VSDPLRTRPLGITIISILLGIDGIVEAILGILGLVSGTAPLGGIVFLILGLLTLALAWGLWTLQSWAFWGIVIIEAINVIYAIYEFAMGRANANASSLIFSLILPIVILLYMFLDRNVRRAFNT
jgi:uncharacterized membrane protein (DUF2068 family)